MSEKRFRTNFDVSIYDSETEEYISVSDRGLEEIAKRMNEQQEQLDVYKEAILTMLGLENEVERKLLLKAVAKLSERERTIISLRFGLGNGNDKELTQKEVAGLLGISQSYISRLEKKIMKQLKKEMLKENYA